MGNIAPVPGLACQVPGGSVRQLRLALADAQQRYDEVSSAISRRTSAITLVWGLVTRFLPAPRPRVARTSLKLWLLSVTGWWAHPLRRGTNRGTNTQSILGNPGLPERTPWASVQVGRSWRGSGLLVNGRSAVRIRSPAPSSAWCVRTSVRTCGAPVQRVRVSVHGQPDRATPEGLHDRARWLRKPRPSLG